MLNYCWIVPPVFTVCVGKHVDTPVSVPMHEGLMLMGNTIKLYFFKLIQGFTLRSVTVAVNINKFQMNKKNITGLQKAALTWDSFNWVVLTLIPFWKEKLDGNIQLLSCSKHCMITFLLSTHEIQCHLDLG